MQLGIDTVPVLVGHVSYLLLSKPAKGVEKTLSLLSLLGDLLPIYKYGYLTCSKSITRLVNLKFLLLTLCSHREVVDELKAAGASFIQFDEPALVLDLEPQQLEAFTKAYSELESSLSGLSVFLETYFADIPAETYKLVGSHYFPLHHKVFFFVR